jgi:PKD repeat protein
MPANPEEFSIRASQAWPSGPGTLRATFLTLIGVVWLGLLQSTALAYWPPVQNVQATVTYDNSGEFKAPTLVLRALDPVTGAWVTSEVTYPSDTRYDSDFRPVQRRWDVWPVVTSGIVSWVARTVHSEGSLGIIWPLIDCEVGYATYDPASHSWKMEKKLYPGSWADPSSNSDYKWDAGITVKDGVVVWWAQITADGNHPVWGYTAPNLSEVGYATFDPAASSWQTCIKQYPASQNPGNEFGGSEDFFWWRFDDASLCVKDGLAAWSGTAQTSLAETYGQSEVVFAVYDPVKRAWQSDLAHYGYAGGDGWHLSQAGIQDAVFSWKTTHLGVTTSYSRGYDHSQGKWTAGPTVPFAYFNASLASGIAPATVSFTDMSIGAASGSWNFGDGASSSERSLSHTYASPGEYPVVQTITSPQGSSTYGTTISVTAKPTVVTRGATDITVATATLNGTVNPNGLATTARFEYGLTSAYGSTANVTLSPNSGFGAQNVSADISGLQAGATYHYRLSATNSGGTSLGGHRTFSTPYPFTYTITEGAITITGYKGLGGDVVVPDMINGLPVTRIGDEAFQGRASLTGVTLPASVTSIGSYAFQDTNLSSIIIPVNVTHIGDGAFEWCHNLISVAIPVNVSSLGEGGGRSSDAPS